MIIGHNPSISWLISQLSGKHIANAPTCTIATFFIPSEHWKATGTATPVFLDIANKKKQLLI